MGDSTKFNGNDGRGKTENPADLRLDATKRSHTRLGFPTPPPTPGVQNAFPMDEVTKRAPVPAQLVKALRPSQPARAESTQPFAAEMPVPPPASGRTLAPAAIKVGTVPPAQPSVAEPRQPSVAEPRPAESAGALRPGAGGGAGGAESQFDAEGAPQAGPGRSPGTPSLRLNTADFGQAATQSAPPAQVGGNVGGGRPRLRLNESGVKQAQITGMEQGSGPRLQLGEVDNGHPTVRRRRGGRGLIIAVLALALAGGAVFALKQGPIGFLATDSQVTDGITPNAPLSDVRPTGAAAAEGQPAIEAVGQAEALDRLEEPSGVRNGSDPVGAADTAKKPDAKKQKGEPEAARANSAAKAQPAKRVAKAARKAATPSKRPSPAAPASTPVDPNTSASVEEARKALQALGQAPDDDDQVLELRPSSDEAAEVEASEFDGPTNGDGLPPAPPPPPPLLGEPPAP